MTTITAFNANDFLAHIVLCLRGLNVEMTHTSGLTNSINRVENPKECHRVTLFGHTPDHEGPQPAYKVEAYAYPADRKLFVQADYLGDWAEILYPSLDGLTPIVHTLKQHGLNYMGSDWQVIVE